MKQKGPVALVILDGFGYSSDKQYNAVYHAYKPHLDTLFNTYPHVNLFAAGCYVGLPAGYIGNSEVGHMTIGAGRVIKQPITRVFESIADKTFFENIVLVKNLQKIAAATGRLHIMGLLSDAGVHSHIEHLYAFLLAAKQCNITQVYVHGFLDGRDVAPRSAKRYIDQLQSFMKKESIGVLVSLHGRFYAMDRDKNWDRTEKSYRVLTEFATENKDWEKLLEQSYKDGITDEFFVPQNITPQGTVQHGDGIICFNVRPDRIRQLAVSFLDSDFNAFKVKHAMPSCFVTPVAYADTIKTNVMFKKQYVKHTIKDVLCVNGKTIFSIAETEKYAHITYFFDGGVEKKYDNETRVLISSKIAKQYVDFPEMSAKQITQAVINSLASNPNDFYLINYANCDMVGHSGNFDATVKAVECIDFEIKKLYDMLVEKMNGTMYITADHGKAECMFNEKIGQPCTAHTSNLVPFIFIKKDLKKSGIKLPLDQLAQIAPFILQQMGIEAPQEMRY